MIYKIYLGLPNLRRPVLFHKIVNRFYLLIFKRLFNNSLINKVEKLSKTEFIGINTKERDFTIDVRLTYFPAQINEVSITIKTIFSQTVKADYITLWLSLNQFPDRKIPNKLIQQQKRGLSIEFVEDDLRSHKKYFYAFRKQQDNLVITFEDDVFYPSNTIDSLIQAHLKFPKAIICNRGHRINFKDDVILKYRSWSHNYKNITPSLDAVPTGVGGVLYPPNSYSKEIFDVETFKEICFYADDLWLKIHSIRVGTKVLSLRTFSRDLISVGKSQNVKLVQHNAIEGGNDEQLNKLLDYYKITTKNFEDEA